MMEREQQIIQQIKIGGVLPLFYHDDTATCIAITKSMYIAGIRCIEFTNRGPQALQNFRALVKLRDEELKDMLLATGTIKTAEHAKQFIDAGADLLISPFFDSAVCDEAYLQKILWIPGCMTPSEIHVAEQAGCNMIKLFPGNTIGPGFVEAILPLFPDLDFVVTGGVDTSEDNIRSWFKAGVAAIGMGSKLISKNVLQQQDYDGLTGKTQQVISIVQHARSAK